MFKNMLKRSWLSIIRKPGRAVLISLLIFAMANLVLSSLAIKSAVAESMNYAKSSLGGSVYLQTDIEKLREQQTQGGATSTTPGTRPQIVRPTTSLSMVESIADSEYVKDYTYSITAQAKSNEFTPIETQSGGFGGMRGGGAEAAETQLEGDISIQGINSYAFIEGVQNETMKLSSGEYFDENTNDQAIISYDLAESNGIKVGDSISMQNINDSTAHQVKVIGIYDLTTDEQSFGNPANTVYMNTATAAKYLSSESFNDGDYNVQNVRFELTGAEQTDAFIAQANQKFPNLESDNLLLSIDTSAYDQMVGPIESVGSFATTIFWVVIIASVVIITLIVTINVKDRRYEMGVLLSLGATKFNVAAQILTELLVVGTVALVLSVATGTLVAKSMSEGLLANQMNLSEQQEEQGFGRPGMGGGRGGMMGNPATSQSDVEAIDSINVNANPSDFALLFAIGYGVIILALILPIWNIVKYQPKTILTGKE